MTLADAVADEVRRRATGRGLSQRELADRAGIPPTLVHRAWRGERPFELDEVERIARVLGVSVVWLIDCALRRSPADRGDAGQDRQASDAPTAAAVHPSEPEPHGGTDDNATSR